MRHVHARRRANLAVPDAPSALAVAKRWTWPALVALPFALFWIVQFASYQVLADPLFGGDSWQQFGITLHIYDGHAPWTDSYFSGEWAFRDWLMYVTVAAIAKATTLDPLTVAIYWPIVPLVGGGLATYAIGMRLFRHAPIALGLSALWMGAMPWMAYQSSSLAAMLTMPLFVLALVSQDGSTKRRVLLGLAWGAASLSYLVAFFASTLALCAVVAWKAWKDRALAPVARAAAPVLLTAAPVILALWGPLLLTYGMDVQNPSHVYSDGGRGWGAGDAFLLFGGLFVDTTHPFQLLLSLAALFGIVAALAQWESHGGKWAILLLGVGLVGTFHYLVTMPLLDTHLVFFRWPKVVLMLAKLLLIGQALAWVALDRERDELRPLPLGIALVVIALGAFAITPSAVSESAELARVDDDATAKMLEGAAWIRENTPEDAVFLALDQEAYGLNGLTGKHVTTTRRTHASTFVDMDQRHADTAIMLYGTDRAYARQLMDEYGVTHAYKGWFWETNEQKLSLVVSPEHKGYLEAHGVRFTEGHAPYDPSGKDVQFFEALLVDPNEGDEPLFLQDFQLVYESRVDGAPWMQVYERPR